MNTKPLDVLYCSVDQNKIERASPVLDETNLALLYKYIHRRYKVHLRKDVYRMDPPWTKDLILQKYRFTNVRREHDRETRWLIGNIVENSKISYEDKILNCVLFRIFNKHETSELLRQPIKIAKCYDPESYRHVLEGHQSLFTGAFYTAGMKRVLAQYVPEEVEDSVPMRVMYFIQHLRYTGFCDKLQDCKTQEEAYDLINSYQGLGYFMSYQIFVDLTYIDEFPFSENEFTVAGPGCQSGIDYLFTDKDGMTYEECLFWVRDNIDRLFTQILNKPWDPEELFKDLPVEDRYLNVMSLENCFCELSKYIRAKTNTGRPKKKYVQSKEEY